MTRNAPREDAQYIDTALAMLRAAWIAQPTLRLGQLIDNAHQTATRSRGQLAPALFYIDDRELLAGIAARVAIPQRAVFDRPGPQNSDRRPT